MTEYYGWDNWNDSYDHQGNWYYDYYYEWYEWADSLTAYGYSGNDYLAGDSNSDTIYGHSGQDTLYGEEGNDFLDAGSSTDSFWDYNYLDGGSGSDTLYGGAGSDTLVAGWSDNSWDYNYLDGGGSSDTLYGSWGNDVLLGSNSTAYNGSEYDVLFGGAGYDIFVLGQSWGNSYQGNGYATITDFNAWDDQLQINWGWGGVGFNTSENYAGEWWLPDTTIYANGDLVAVIQDNTNFSGADFNWV